LGHGRDRRRGHRLGGALHRDHPLFATCAAFCEHWDQSSFDPDYDMEPLETFAPMVRAVFARKAYDPAVLREGEVTGLVDLLGPGTVPLAMLDNET
jgi:predicted HD phosphohydrolase